MSLQAAALEVAPSRPGGVCSFVALFASLDKDDTAFLNALLNDASKTHSYIGAVLRRDEHDIPDTTVGRHRNGKCRCATR